MEGQKVKKPVIPVNTHKCSLGMATFVTTYTNARGSAPTCACYDDMDDVHIVLQHSIFISTRWQKRFHKKSDRCSISDSK